MLPFGFKPSILFFNEASRNLQHENKKLKKNKLEISDGKPGGGGGTNYQM